MAKNGSSSEAREIAERIAKEIRDNPGSWNDEYRQEVAKNAWSKWMATKPDEKLSVLVQAALLDEVGTEAVPLTVDWYEIEADAYKTEIIAGQEKTCDAIDEAKGALETAKERVKLAQAEIEEGQSALRRLARRIAEPWVYPLPPAPDRQRDLPLGDGEEWRAVPLGEVLKDDVALKSTVEEKLGRINLGQYADLAAKIGQGDKPKKLTRKQWDKVEEAVQDWHASRGAVDEDAAASK